MKNIKTILAELGIELTPEQEKGLTKAVAENYKTVSEFDQKVSGLTAERDSLQTQFNTAKEELSKFDGVDVAALQQQIADANQRIKDAENAGKQALAERDYSDAVRRHVETLAFSSNAAKKAFTADLIAKKLPLEGEKLLGFADYVEAYKAADATAIVDSDAADNAARFTEPMGTRSKKASGKEAELDRAMRAAFGLKQDKEE